MLADTRVGKRAVSSTRVMLALVAGLVTVAAHGVTNTENANPVRGPALTSANGGQLVFVVNRTGNSVAVLDGQTRAQVDLIPVGTRPVALMLLPGADHLYVTLTGRRPLDQVRDGSVMAIDLETMMVDAQIPTGFAPHDMEVTPDGRWAYVADGGGAAVHVLDLSTNTLSESILSPYLDTPSGTAISPDGAYVYVANVRYVNGKVGRPPAPIDNVTVIRTADNTVAGVIDLSDPNTPFGPWDITMLPDGSRAYTNDGDNGRYVIAIDTDPGSSQYHEVIGKISLGGGAPGPRGMESGHTPDGVRVFAGVAEADQVVVIDPATNQIVKRVFTGSGSFPWRVRLSPDGRELWVSLRGLNTVLVLETSQYTEIARLAGFKGPSDIAFSVPATVEDLLERTDQLVQGLMDAGLVNQGQARSLQTKLARTFEGLARDNVNAAVNSLNAFMNEVRALIRSRRLSTADGQKLLDAAQAAIDMLES